MNCKTSLSLLTGFRQILIGSDDSHQSVLGYKALTVQNGSVTFDKVMFVAEPGKKNAIFKLYAPFINTEQIRNNLNLSADYNVNVDYLKFDFRFCTRGEALQNNE
jgi:hypothetical protein